MTTFFMYIAPMVNTTLQLSNARSGRYGVIYGLPWILLANHSTSNKKLVIRGNSCNILFVTCILMPKHGEIDEASHRSIAAPLLFSVGQSVVVLWRHTNTYCDVISIDCPQIVSKWVTCVYPSLSNWLSLVNYRFRATVFSLPSV